MKNFLKFKAWPVVAGLVGAFIIMMIFEYVNSFFYPLPEGLDIKDTAGLQAFTATLPWTAYILVFLGWLLGAFKAGCVTTYLSKERTYKLSFIVGLILTLLGIANNIMIGHDMFFNIVGIPMFLVFTYLGHKYILRLRRTI
ncbi:hypothetical protein K8Q98_00470 [Candidatus Nomurabacteria bacterium]|nr:hypothetical protein [Candidatus Nomurabacteria bacterium]